MRDSRFELLRIISMFLIVMHHYSVHSDWSGYEYNDIYFLFVKSLAFGGKIGVCTFVIITGYFLVNKGLCIINIIKVIMLTWFYSLVLGCVFYFLGFDFNLESITKTLTPLGYWYVIAYISIVLLSPFLNVVIKSSTIASNTNFLFVVLFLVITPVVNFYSGELLVFVSMYIFGAILNKIKVSVSILSLCVFLSVCFLMMISITCIIFLYNDRGFLEGKELIMFSLNSPFVIVFSILMFVVFYKMKSFSSLIINYLSRCMFGVYLIHDNFLVRDYIWDLLNKSIVHESNLYFYSFLCVIFVFLSSSLVEFLRITITSRLNIDLYLCKFKVFIDGKYEKIINSKLYV